MPDIYITDAPSLVYRAFFSYPTTVTDDRGNPVNAVRGFMEMITRLVSDRRPDRLVNVFDSNFRPDFRVAAYPGYKAQRPEDPPELPRQFHVIAEVLDAAGMVRCESDGLEADDAIATLVTGAKEFPITVVTGDRDLLALVRDPDVKVLFPLKGLKEVAEFTEADVAEKYGVPASLYSEFATLRGDSSDGLPGVQGIGPKRAALLLQEYGSIDGILDNLEKLPPKQAQSFEAATDYLTAMRTVVGLVTDAPITATEAHPPDEVLLKELTEVHNLGSSTTRLLQALKGER